MNIREFANQYMAEERAKIEKYALVRCCQDFCDGSRNAIAISNILYRNGVRSIVDLYNLEYEKVKTFQGIGSKRAEMIKEFKDFLNKHIDEEAR